MSFKFRCDNKEDEDFYEKYGCVCCGGGYLHLNPIKWFYKMADMIDYVKSLGTDKGQDENNKK